MQLLFNSYIMLSEITMESDCNGPFITNDTSSSIHQLLVNLSVSQDSNDTFPEHLRFTDSTLTVVLVYGALFLVAAIGNLTVFISLFRSRHRKSRINLMIRHLALADLLVTFIMIPLEIGWRLTTQWVAGNFACKVFLFLRAFGLYLSSNVLVCVSLDRYFAVLHPLKVNDARRRGKVMLACAWGVSLLYSIPQSVVFHVSTHPKYPNFSQCVTYGFFTSTAQEIIYNLLCLIAMYFIPLLVIIVTYTAIMCEISNKSKETKDITCQSSKPNGRLRLRRSDITNIERARSRTLRMTITIVLVFLWCWTPYVVMTMWYMFDRESASKLPSWLQDTLFMMAVSNSCMNPLVYGSYVINFRKECSKCVHCFAENATPTLARKSTDAVMLAVSSGVVEQPGLARRLIKYILVLRKGSLATKSTTLQGAIEKPMAAPNDPQPKKKSPRHVIGRSGSIDITAHLTEPPGMAASSSHRNSFHSDPYPFTTFPSPTTHKRISQSTCSHQEHLYGTCYCIETTSSAQWRPNLLDTEI